MAGSPSLVRRLAGSLALAAGSLLATLLLLEAGFRLAGVSVGTVQINRATVRRSDDPRLRFELRPGSAVRAGRVVGEPVSTLDLFPTIVSLTGSTLPARRYDGQDVSRLLTGEVEKIGGSGIDGGREIAFFGPDGAAGLRSGRWKYLRPGPWSGTATLFDLDADPGEKADLSQARPELLAQLEARLKEILE